MQFSIIIPTKNEEKQIGRCLDSLLHQDWSSDEYEIIVIDNGSGDRTASIARAKGARVSIKPGCSIGALRNFGARVATGEILAFIDADCTVPADWLHHASPYLTRKDVACFGSPPVVPDGATWVQRTWYRVRRKKHGGEASWLEAMNMFVPRGTFLAAGGFSETLETCEDYDLSIRLKNIGALIADDRIVAVHHGEAASIRQFFRKELWRGRGNLSGVKSHGILLNEVPSVVFPYVYGILTVLVVVCSMTALLTGNALFREGVALVFLAWQAPLLGLALRKSGVYPSPAQALQLYLLLNVYFLARGCSGFQRTSR